MAVGSSRREDVRASLPAVEVVADPAAAARHPAADLVVIATPNASHASLAEAALRAGKHVVVDKPFCVTLEESRRVTAVARGVGRLVSVFQNRRWDSDYIGITRAIAGGDVGEVVEFRSEMSRYRPEVRDRWRERAEPGAGLWFDLGSHLVDQAMLLFGPPPRVYADIRVQRRGGVVDDWFHVVLAYRRSRVLLSSSLLAADGHGRFLVRGTAGSLTKHGLDPQEAALAAGKVPGGPDWGADPEPVVLRDAEGRVRWLPSPAGDYPAYYTAVRDAIAGRGPMPVTPAQATSLMAVIEAGVRSSAERRAVVPEYDDAERAAWPVSFEPEADGGAP